jgi:hypothetical protein
MGFWEDCGRFRAPAGAQFNVHAGAAESAGVRAAIGAGKSEIWLQKSMEKACS